MRAALALAVLASVTAAGVGPTAAGEAIGEVREIIIKIETPEGPRWYRLGTDLLEIDISEGSVVRFNYADDTIESIEVEEVTPESDSSQQQ